MAGHVFAVGLESAARLRQMVFLLVDPQVLLAGEPLAAVLTGKRPLSSVDALVCFQVARLREALAALSAAVRPLASVHAHVRLQAPRRGEAFPAVAAHKPSVPAVPVKIQRIQSRCAHAQR